MTDLNKCRVSPAGNIITARCKISFPNLFTARKFDETDEKAKYSASFLIPPAADISLLIEGVKKAAADKWGTALPPKLKSPFLKAGEYESTGDFEGWTLLRTSAITKPGIVDASGKNIGDESEIYPGRWCLASLRPYAYEHKKGGKGVSFGLQNVQMLEHDEPIGGRARAESEFEQVDTVESSSGSKQSADSVFG